MGPCYRRQYWDGTSHLQIFHLQYWDGAFSPAAFFWQIFHMQFWDGTVQGCQIHRKKKINGLMAVLPQRLHVSR